MFKLTYGEDRKQHRTRLMSEERLEVQQDLYGTHVELEETDDLRETLLEEMQTCLDAIPDDDKRVYLEACQVCPRIVTSESAPIRFLRCENYQPEVKGIFLTFVF